jgi:alkylation response protein AidB-like acyl-CoA dehydrogenase
MEVGTDEQKARFLPTMASSEIVWAQAWSEPNAGSDLASLRSTGVLTDDGSEWVLNGQKIWASRAVWADWCFGIFRTDPEAERHRGLTFVLVPLDSPGVTVRPIAQLDGDTGFAEIFFDDVHVPVENTLGEVNQGWRVTMATAGFERGVSLRSPARFSAAADRLVALWREHADPSDTALRDAVADVWMQAEGYKLHTYMTVTQMIEGGTIGAEASLNKIFWSEMDVRIHELALDIAGPEAERMDGPFERWVDGFLFSLSGPIYAGTNEIQRNIIADRVLQLPRGA